jgi:hypothetical protein
VNLGGGTVDPHPVRSPVDVPSGPGGRGSAGAGSSPRPVVEPRGASEALCQGGPKAPSAARGTLDNETGPVGFRAPRHYDVVVAIDGKYSVPGHSLTVKRTESGRRWVCDCTCGYRCATRVTETQAMGAGIHHVLKLKAELRRNGQESVTRLHRSA